MDQDTYKKKTLVCEHIIKVLNKEGFFVDHFEIPPSHEWYKGIKLEVFLDDFALCPLIAGPKNKRNKLFDDDPIVKFRENFPERYNKHLP